MSLAIQKRLKFIESRLYWEGVIRRKHLEDFFEISTPQATQDIKKYVEEAPDNIIYNKKSKQYEVTDNFQPIYGAQTSDDYLNKLLFLKRKTSSNEFFCGPIPSYRMMPKIKRFVDVAILKKVVESIRNSHALQISYQSMSKDMPSKRWITPHSFGYDGHRWHVRALCHNKRLFCDFNVGRILNVFGSQKHDFDFSLDYKWNTDIVLIIAAHPKLVGGKKACVELDYDMENGCKEVVIKAAFYYYLRNELNFKEGHEELDGEKQQIILRNWHEIETQFSFLEEMSKNDIEKASKGERFL